MILALFNDYALIKDKLFYYKIANDNVVCNLCYFNDESMTDSCCNEYRNYIGETYLSTPYCYALGIERFNKDCKISNRIPMIAIIKPFLYKLSLFVYKFITRNNFKFKIYKI